MEQRQALAEMAEAGPIPAVHGVVRWPTNAGLTDFNDLETARGKAAFEALLKKALGQDKARERTPGRQAPQRQAQGMAV